MLFSLLHGVVSRFYCNTFWKSLLGSTMRLLNMYSYGNVGECNCLRAAGESHALRPQYNGKNIKKHP